MKWCAEVPIETLLLLKPSHGMGKPTDSPLTKRRALQEQADRLIDMADRELDVFLVATTSRAQVIISFIISQDFRIGRINQVRRMDASQGPADDWALKATPNRAFTI